MIPPRKFKIPARKLKVDLILNCSKCGHGKIFKGVSGVDYSNLAKLVPLLNEVGWQCMPEMLCRSCASPMDGDEMNEWREIMQKVELGGNDGADVYEAESFREHMREKYGWKVERFFATTD